MFDEIADIIESFEFEIEDGGPDASNICVLIDDVKKLMRRVGELKEALSNVTAQERERYADALISATTERDKLKKWKATALELMRETCALCKHCESNANDMPCAACVYKKPHDDWTQPDALAECD